MTTCCDSEYEYKVEDLWTYSKDMQPIELDVADLTHNLHGTLCDEPMGSPEFEERANRADLSQPIIVFSYREDGMWIADGMHRFWRLWKNGEKKVMAKVLNESDMEKINRVLVFPKDDE